LQEATENVLQYEVLGRDIEEIVDELDEDGLPNYAQLDDE
jgi:hypothetical protein